MRKAFFLFFALSSILSLNHAIKACGTAFFWWDRPEHLFLKDLLSDSSYYNYGNQDQYYYNYRNDVFEGLPKAMVQEWQSRFPQASSQDIQKVLFSLSPSDIEQLKNGQNPAPGNSFWAAILNAGSPYVDYMDLVFKENSAVLPPESQWDLPVKNIPKLKELLTEVLPALESTKDAFLAQKYLYMAVKIQHAVGAYAEAIKSFDKFEAPAKSLSYYRAMGYKAGALRRTGDTLQAKILFARIFDQCPVLRFSSLRDFNHIKLSPNQYVSQVDLNTEKSAIWMMQYIHENSRDITALEALYQSDPSSGRLELVILREMNAIHLEYLIKLREHYLADTSLLVRNPKLDDCGSMHAQIEIQTVSTKEKGWFAKLWESIINFLKRLFGKSDTKKTTASKQTHDSTNHINPVLKLPYFLEEEWVGEYVQLLEKIVKEDKVKNKALFRTALGYCYLINGQFAQADPIFKELSASSNTSVAQLNEYLALWSGLMGHEKVRPPYEESFTAYHQKYGKSTDEAQQIRLSDLKQELTRRYLVEQQYIKALLIHESHYDSDMLRTFYTCDMLDSLSEYIKKTPSSNLEKHFRAPTAEKVHFYKLRKLLLMGRFDEALKYDEAYNFKSYIKGTEDTEDIASLKALVEWQQKGDAESLLKIADVIAQSTLWEYNVYPWGRWKGYHLSYGYMDGYNETTPSADYPFNVSGLAETYLNRAYQESKRSNSISLAESYYLKAISISKDDNFKAEAYFKAQALRIKSLDPEHGKSDYYGILNTQYEHTPYYKSMYNSCSFLRFGKVIDYYNY